MKVYTEDEVRKLRKSFLAFLQKNNVPTCNIHVEIYHPVSIEVELHAHEKQSVEINDNPWPDNSGG